MLIVLLIRTDCYILTITDYVKGVKFYSAVPLSIRSNVVTIHGLGTAHAVNSNRNVALPELLFRQDLAFTAKSVRKHTSSE